VIGLASLEEARLKRLLVGLLLALAPATAGAVDGTYRGQWHSAVVRHVEGTRHEIEVETWNGRGCGGGVTLTADITPRRDVLARAVNPSLNPLRPYCEVILRFRGRRLSIQEGESCLYFHGAACEFTGTLTLR
jgi:hypothetical protein